MTLCFATGIAALLMAALASLGAAAPARADALNGYQCDNPSPSLHFNGVLPDGSFGQSYDAQIQASGGTPPYTFESQAQGTWPAGLSMSTSGEVSGVPLTAGNFQVVIVVSDSGSPAQCTSDFVYLHLNNGTEGTQQTLQQTLANTLGLVNGLTGGLTGCLVGTVGAVLGQGPAGGACH